MKTTDPTGSEGPAAVSPSIPDRFAQVVSQHPNRIAVQTADRVWSYLELDERSTTIAGKVLDVDGRAEVVALLLSHGATLVAAILGVLKAGRMYLALDPSEPVPRLTAMLGDSRATVVLTEARHLPLAGQLTQGRHTVVTLGDELPSGPTRLSLPGVPGDSGAWLVYTSGSTGTPKGVWQNHRGVIHHAGVYGELIGVTPEDRLSLLTSLSLAASATHLFTALLQGATLCPFPLRSEGVGRLASWLSEARISVLHTVPTVFRHLLRQNRGNVPWPHLRRIRLGGEALLADDVARVSGLISPECRLVHALSSTETGLICALMLDRRTLLPSGRVPAGHPVRGVEVLLTDEHGHSVAGGGEGRIAVRSTHLAQGYWGCPEATAASFRSGDSDDGRRTFLTGDLGRFRGDGMLEHLGRLDSQAKIRGHRVDLAEVEAALHATDQVSQAAVVVREDPPGDPRMVAYLVPRSAGVQDSHACLSVLRALLPGPMLPSQMVWLDRLPQTPGGKLDRRALPQPPPVAGPRSGPKPRDGVERKVARVLGRVLRTTDLRRTDDLFELGANSLQAAEVLAGLEETFGVVLSPADLVEHRTVEALAARIAEQSVVRSPRSLVTLRNAPSGRPLFLVHSGHGDVATYVQLARRLPGRPIHGLQAVGLQGESWPLMSIRSMAQHYLPEILAADPQGPYFLGGTCMGGLVAFELACRLVAQGRAVAFVGLMDTTAPPFGGNRSPWVEMLLDPVRDTLRIARWAVLRALGHGRGGRGLPAYRHFIGSITARARYYYRPGFYPGTLTQFSTAETPCPRGDRRQLMARHASQMITVRLPGRREELFLKPQVDELARQLQSCLAAAESASGGLEDRPSGGGSGAG